MIELSVHLITYNNEKYIDETIQSILKQQVDFTYEIVVGDDCSKDATFDIINKYHLKHPNLFKIKKNDSQLGILKNFKATLDRCQGKYVFDIAGDDLLKKEDTLQKLVNVLSRNPNLGFVDSGFDKIFAEKKPTILFANKKLINLNKQQYKKEVLLSSIIPIGVCFNKEHLYKHVDFESYINKGITIDDYPILVDLVMNTDFARINESLHIYRVHDDSYSHKRTFESHSFILKQAKDLFEYFTGKYSFSNELIEKYNKKYLKRLLYFAGFFEKKELGKQIFEKLKNKSIRDYTHYYASQYPLFRKLISIL